MSRGLVGALAALLAVGLANEAAAGDATCIWDELSAQNRAEVIQAYAERADAKEAYRAAWSAVDVVHAMDGGRRCIPKPSIRAILAAGNAIRVYGGEAGSEALLQERFQIAPADLDRVWRAIPPRASQRLQGALSADPLDAGLTRIIARAIAALRPSGGDPQADPAAAHIIIHLAARSSREEWERGF